MSLLVKICGLSTADGLETALDAGADMVGFVFFPPSPRHIGLKHARTLGERVRGRARKVALTVDANNEQLARIIEALQPDMLQLHGREDVGRVAVVRTRFGLPVMKALPLAAREDLNPIRVYAKVADSLLFDARAPQEATRPGGLNAGNVAEALGVTRAPGVDVSSGVERAPGVKDPEKIRAFVGAARAAAVGITHDPETW